jgi:hypothetical protein
MDRSLVKRVVDRATLLLLLLGCVLVPPTAAGQEPTATSDPSPRPPSPSQPVFSAAAYVPITGRGRFDWTVEGTIGIRSLTVVGPLAGAVQTGFNMPSEWTRSWSGFGKRYLEREADVAISNTLEAGLGAIWGEEPRYVPSGRKGIWPRARYAMKTVFLSQRRDGRLAPAWGRYAANVFNNIIENTWLPPSVTTWQQTTFRAGSGFLGRLGGNLWEEFWPDARKRWIRR